MVRVSSPAKLRPWSELTAKMVMGVVPGLVNPQTRVDLDVCLGMLPMYLVKSLSGTRSLVDTQCICPFRPKESVGRKGQIHCVSARPLVPREGLYQIHGQSLNTHQGEHRSGPLPKGPGRIQNTTTY